MLIIISRSRYNQCTKKEIMIAICTMTIWRSRISSCLSPSRYPTKLYYILRHWRHCSPIGKMLKSECAVMGTDHSRSILSDYGGDTRTPVSLGDAMADIIMPFPILNTLRQPYMSTIPAFHQHNVKTITILWIWLYHPNCLVRQRSANWITAHCIDRQLHCRILPEWTEKCWITANSKVPLPYKVALPGGLKSIKPDHHLGSGNCGRGPTKYGHRRQKGGSKSNSEHAQWQFRTSGFSNFLFGVGQEYGLEDRREISISAIRSCTQTSETHVKK
jgi:hypothetical protein